ncbi:endolytic transglycosylase MltG [Selenihalanaerobacter shriftii]|uniref:Endolytic murein transglycosylase n=1 Tax=Selenihalanaerobacter shriftii TaxID=142842 RepID=A0A1T4QL97_9FIRM|nr:endolytic transglycosylase MltG [Selenihalanaerobacter shriftii]SKA04489.1 UPF0755 protein [Selenihalanaerobacter shriftii]
MGSLLKINSHKRHNSVAVIVMVIFILFLASISYWQEITGPIDKSEFNHYQIRVKPGFSSNQVANLLDKKGLIRDPLLFKIMAKVKGVEAKLQTGYYKLDTSMSINQMLDKLSKGKVIMYQFSIPEGFTIEEIAQRVAGQFEFSADEFLITMKNLEIKNYPFLKDVTEEVNLNNRNYLLEGYLFPETYRIAKGAEVKVIINQMLNEFKDKLNQNLISKIKKSDYNLDQIITIASLIEAEAKYDSERRLVSSVIYNRLEIGMPLQIDATIQYIIPGHKDKILYSDLTLKSPYNIYQNLGLPPGPINNPGLASIKAALNPADTDYLYYFALDNGEHKFSETYRQHIRLQNELKY